VKWTMNRTLLRYLSAGLALCAASTVSAQTSPLQNNGDPWFEIELIAFERGSLNSTLEKFNQQITAIPVQRSVDLLGPLYQPDIRAISSAFTSCDAAADSSLPADLQIIMPQPQPWFDEVHLAEQSLQSFTGVFPAEPLLRWPLTCRRNQLQDDKLQEPALITQDPDSNVDGPQLLPVVPVPIPPLPVQHQHSPYLVDESAFQLKDLAWQLDRRAGHKLLLHTAWRQSLGVKRRSQTLRFFAGQRFSPQFDYQGLRQAEQAAIAEDQADLQAAIARTYQQLQQNQQLSRDGNQLQVSGLPDQVWQLDGIIQPYNERMLFADTEFNLRQLVKDPTGDRLQTFYVKDNVRLLLGEIHYLDHPRFGLILQIRRFTPPVAPDTGEGVNP
jgi:hypothetical protein